MAISEAQVQGSIMDMLEYHPQILFCRRFNSGAVQTKHGTWVKLGKKGDSDIIGMTTSGKFLAIETKRLGKKPTKDQWNFINAINDNNGIAFYADSFEMFEQKLEARL